MLRKIDGIPIRIQTDKDQIVSSEHFRNVRSLLFPSTKLRICAVSARDSSFFTDMGTSAAFRFSLIE